MHTSKVLLEVATPGVCPVFKRRVGASCWHGNGCVHLSDRQVLFGRVKDRWVVLSVFVFFGQHCFDTHNVFIEAKVSGQVLVQIVMVCRKGRGTSLVL